MFNEATRTRRTLYAMARRSRPDDINRLVERRELRISDLLTRGNKRLRAFRRANDAILDASRSRSCASSPAGSPRSSRTRRSSRKR